MTRAEIIKALDEEILRLQHAKQLLQGTRQMTPALANLVDRQQPRGRIMSAEGRKRIADAQKRRWAKVKGL